MHLYMHLSCHFVSEIYEHASLSFNIYIYFFFTKNHYSRKKIHLQVIIIAIYQGPIHPFSKSPVSKQRYLQEVGGGGLNKNF